MNLIEQYKELINEADSHKLEYGCVMAMIPVNEKGWQELLSKIDPKDIYGEVVNSEKS